MTRRTRVWIPFYQTATVAASGTKTASDMLANFETEVGLQERSLTIERIIGTVSWRATAVANNMDRSNFGIAVMSEHIDSDDFPNIETASGRWMWQQQVHFIGAAHDSTSVTDQRVPSTIPIDVAVMRKIHADQKLFWFIHNAGSHGIEYFLHVRILTILP